MDLALVKNGLLYDLDFDGRDLKMTESLYGGILFSLGIKALSDDDVSNKDARLEKEPAGWWANALESVQIGSTIWSIKKKTSDYLSRVKESAEKALAWIVSDGVAAEVTVDASDVGEVCEIDVTVRRPDGRTEEFTFQKNWEES